MELRLFQKQDAESAKRLILSVLAQEYPFDKSAYSDSDLDKIEQVYSGERNSFFVVEEGGAIVGTAGVKEDSKDAALLRRLFVDASYRRRGFGSGLLKKAMSFCREKGYKQMIFNCTGRMTDAMNLCKNSGFKETEEIEMGGFKIHRLSIDL
ncbi:MAG: GNAT family N-acetyltransferase [Candidatus Omnitrophota bacterium]